MNVEQTVNVNLTDLTGAEGFGSASGNFVGNRNYHPPLLDRPRSSTPDTDSNHDDEQVLSLSPLRKAAIVTT